MTAKFPAPDEVFEDAYRIEAILGSGGFARVYRATEIGLERKVALKILRPPTHATQSDSQRDDYLETLMKRFEREARMLSKLRSTYTVNLYKYGKTEDGLLYMALEYIDGLSLAEILRAGKPLPAPRTAKILRQVLQSLQEAHALGMLHRDLKPANIMVFEHMGESDQVKLLDFGIAKLVTDHQNDNSKDLTGDGTLVGTPRYMSPEQIQGSEIGPPADVYALGLVAYELVTGERAIKGDSSIQIIGKQLAPESFVLPEDAIATPGLRYVIDRMMEKRIEHRYPDTAAVLADLERPGLLDDLSAIPELALDGIIEIDDFEDDDAFAATQTDHLHDSTFDGPFPTSPLSKALPVLLLTFVIGLVAAIMLARDTEAPAPLTEVDTTTPDESRDRQAKEPEVVITARLGGSDLEGVTVLVDGVEKGVTPLRLTAGEVRSSQVVARYKLPDGNETVESSQDVADPRDVILEFDAAVSELVRPVEEELPLIAEPELDPKPEATPKPEPKPEPKPRPRPKPKPKPEPNVYIAPE